MNARIPHALALAAALTVAGTALAADRELTGSTDAKGLKTLRLEAHVGTVEVIGTDAERISWKLRVEPDDDGGWFKSGKDAQAAVDGAKVRAVAAGDAWELEIELPRGADLDDVEEHWTVEVPKRFALELEANVGEVSVKDLAGGVEADLNVGELRIDAIGGAIDAEVNVGDLSVLSRTKSLGPVELEANVGDADLRIAGKRVESGGAFMVGARVSASHDGTDEVRATVNVGSVSVKVD